MKVMLLAAGKSERLRGLNRGLPKVLIPVLGRPILEHNLRYLKGSGIRQVMVNLHYHADEVSEFINRRKDWGLSIAFSREEELLGTAGAVKKAERYFGKSPFLVMYGDNLTDFDIRKLFAAHRRTKALVTLGVYDPKKTAWSGIAAGLVRVKGGKVAGFAEKKSNRQVPGGNWVNAGILVASPGIFRYIPAKRPYDFARDLFPRLMKKKRVIGATDGASYVLASDNRQALQKTRRLARTCLNKPPLAARSSRARRLARNLIEVKRG